MMWRIGLRQTTYWDLQGTDAKVRIHFLHKQEQHFSEPDAPSFEITDAHPVLLDYEFPWESIYLTSAPAEPRAFLQRLQAAVAQEIAPWRSVSRYLNQQAGPLTVLQSGYGLLFSGPLALVENVSRCLSEGKVSFRNLPGQPARWPMQALILGTNYIVAKGFRVKHLARPAGDATTTGFADPWNPSSAEVRAWAYTPSAPEPCEAWDLALSWSRHERDYLELAADPDCPQQAFFLRLLYFIVGNAVHGSYRSVPEPVIRGFIQLAANSRSSSLRLWHRRALELLKQPELFDYRAWCGGGLASEST